ncbi:hypothetical protein [Agromyces sp. Soil535]|uniref:hypothetical protein n=1 Tax=Agromyces sp. Soil535 TaxID=1736390 RepID=UPI00138F6A29|nr:hypothetical protein [Agromyces sp. Soil535]
MLHGRQPTPTPAASVMIEASVILATSGTPAASVVLAASVTPAASVTGTGGRTRRPGVSSCSRRRRGVSTCSRDRRM